MLVLKNEKHSSIEFKLVEERWLILKSLLFNFAKLNIKENLVGVCIISAKLNTAFSTDGARLGVADNHFLCWCKFIHY